MENFKDWVLSHFEIRGVFTLLYVINTCYGTSSSYRGYSSYYVFGVKVARIQRTKPWE